jgi:hypothetical protein
MTAGEAVTWINTNEGVVTVLIFLATIFLGWASGIFASLRRRPVLGIRLIPGPTFCSTFTTGDSHKGYDVHRTAFALYLNVSNIGSAPTSLESVSIGYHLHLKPSFSLLWLRYRLFWYWLNYQTITLTDFQANIGDGIKVFPSLFQASIISGTKPETYLEVGRSVNGVVYFEQSESWGGCFPSPQRGSARIIVAITDAFGTHHKKRFWIPIVGLDEAKKYNPSFGDTLPTLRRGPTPPS